MRYKVLPFFIIIVLLILAVLVHVNLSDNTRNHSPNMIAVEQSPQKLPALIRLEDICPGVQYKSQENLDKLIVIADYLHKEGIPFEVSLIPRAVEPGIHSDVTIADNTEYTRKFVATVKILEEKGGIIGIHGYTHQSGNSDSVKGYEFYNPNKNRDVPDTYDYAEDRIDKAIALFNKAGINPAYWETPHYSAPAQQHIAFQEQIGLIYENNYYYPEAWQSNRVINQYEPYFFGVEAVPAPLGHLNSQERLAEIFKSVDNPEKAGTLASLYFHPTSEFNYITKASRANGEVYYHYDEKSLLHQLVNGFKKRGYTFVSIYSLVGFVPAQRDVNIPFNRGDDVFTGQFVPGAAGNSVLIWNKEVNQWHMFQYTASWYAPRKINAFKDLGIWLKDVSLGTGTVPTVGHFKNKDKEDLLLLNAVSGEMLLAVNNGSSFIPNTLKWQAVSTARSILPLAGDLNADGLTDVFIYDQHGGRIGTAINQGGFFPTITWQSFGLLKSKNLKLLAGDYNGDGTSDILVIDFDTCIWHMLIGKQANVFALSPEPWNRQYHFGKDSRIDAADINGDGKDDVITYDPDGLWKSFISDGRKFDYSGSFGPWGSGRDDVALTSDINGDKRADLVMINHNEESNYDLNIAISVLGR